MNDNQYKIYNDKLLLKLRNEFNNKYDDKRQINKIITTKNSLITSARNDLTNTDKNIKIFLNIFCLVLLVLFIFFFIRINLLSPKIGLILTIVALIGFISNIIIRYVITSNTLEDISKATGIGLEKAIGQNLLNIDFDNYKCPKKCTRKPGGGGHDPHTGYIENKEGQRLMRTASSRDVWKYGELPDTLYTTFYDRDPYNTNNNPTIYRYTSEEENLPPKPWVTGLGDKSKSQIFYNCKWIGGPISESDPIKKEYKYSTIPCKYYPGFRTVDTKICNYNNKQVVDCI